MEHNTVIQIHVATHKGTKPFNQDCAGYQCGEGRRFLFGDADASSITVHDTDEGCLVVVSDGVSSFPHSDIAAETIVKDIISYFPAFHSKNISLIKESIVNADKKATSLAFDHIGSKLATTMSALYLNRRKFVMANVGDSPIYRIRNNKIALLSYPDTLYQKKLSEGIDPNEIDPGDHHILMQSMGHHRDKSPVHPHVRKDSIEPDDIYIVMTDWCYNPKWTKDIVLECLQDPMVANPAEESIQRIQALLSSNDYIDNCSLAIIYQKKSS